MLMHVPPSVLLMFKGLDELANCGSTGRWVDERSEFSHDVLIGEGELILHAFNIG